MIKNVIISAIILLIPLSAQSKDLSIEGEWITKSVNNIEIRNGVTVFTNDSVVTFNKCKEDSREAYSLSGDTLVINRDTSTITYSSDSLIMRGTNDTIILIKFDPKMLTKSEQKLLDKIKGNWYVWGVSEKDSIMQATDDMAMQIVINNITIDVFSNNRRNESSSFSIIENQIKIGNDSISIERFGDTLKMHVGPEACMILIPFKYAPLIDTAFYNEKGRCAEAISAIRMFISFCAMYEAETGKFPSSMDEIIKTNEISIPDHDWKYTCRTKDSVVYIRAIIKDGINIGEIKSGNFIEFSNLGEKTYSHKDLKEKYLVELLKDAKFVKM